MTSYSKITLYVKKNLGKTARSFYVSQLESSNYIWKNFTPLIRFFQNYCKEDDWNRNYETGIEMTPRLIRTFYKKLLSIPNILKENNIEGLEFDKYDPYHRNLYLKLGKIFFFKDEDYDEEMKDFINIGSYINFFKEIVDEMDNLEKNNLSYVVVLNSMIKI